MIKLNVDASHWLSPALQVLEGVAHELLKDKNVFVLDSKVAVDNFDSS
jgi:hypothetical protein